MREYFRVVEEKIREHESTLLPYARGGQNVFYIQMQLSEAVEVEGEHSGYPSLTFKPLLYCIMNHNEPQQPKLYIKTLYMAILLN